MLIKTQINKLKKAMNTGVGSDIKISKTQIRKFVQQGGTLWSSLMGLAPKIIPMATKYTSKMLAPLATGAVSALGSLGVDKLFRSGSMIEIRFNNINQLVPF